MKNIRFIKQKEVQRNIVNCRNELILFDEENES